MKDPAEIPQPLIDTVRAAVTDEKGEPMVGLPEMTDGAIVTVLAAAWEEIYSYGYTDGFSDKEEPHCCGQ